MTGSDAPAASPWSPLRARLFRLFWLALVVSNVGTWMHQTSATWMMTSLAPSPLTVSLMQTATTLPFFLLALPAGAVADVLDRRMVLGFAQVWMLATAVVLGALAIAGHLEATGLLALTFSIGIGAALSAPAQQALVPELVESKDLPQAVALNGIAFNVARAIGPALGGILTAALGAGPVFLLNAVSFAGVLAVLTIVPRAALAGDAPAENIVGAMRAGARYAAHAGPFRTVLLRGGAFVLPATALWALLPVVARNDLGVSAAGYGALLGCIGVGAIAGASFLPRVRRRFGVQNLVAAATAGFAVSTLALAFVRSVPLLAAAMFAGGIAWMAAMSSLNVAAQSSVPAWVRARGLAIYLLVSQGGMAVGGLVWGWIGAVHGVPFALGVAAAGLLASLAVVRRHDLDSIESLDLRPARPWHDPPELSGDAGPVLVLIEYDVAAEDRYAFLEAMHRLRPLRLRDGALEWNVYEAAETKDRFVETFTVGSWNEHLRQHQRLTKTDEVLRTEIRRFHRGAGPPVVHHFLAAAATQDARSQIREQE